VGIGCDATEAFASTRSINFSESFLSSFGVGLISRAKVHLLFKEKSRGYVSNPAPLVETIGVVFNFNLMVAYNLVKKIIT